MRFQVSKRIDVCASHKLTGLSEGHECMNLHGHNYIVIVDLSSAKLDYVTGMVVDFKALSAVIKQVDHDHLNKFFEPSTAEMFCKWAWDQIEQLVLAPANRGARQEDWVRVESITVHETPSSKAVLSR